MNRLWIYFLISLAIHALVLLIPLKPGPIFRGIRIKRKKEKPTLVRIIEIPNEKPEKKRVKPPKKPKYLSRYTHRTEKESIPKKRKISGRKAQKKMPPPVEKREKKEVVKKEKYKLPPLEDLLPNPEELAKHMDQPLPPIPPEREEPNYGDLSDITSQEKNILSLNTAGFKFISYFASIKRKIELIWSYPREAALMGMEGKLLVRFTIKKDGSLGDVKLLKSSGFKILDDEAINAIKDAAPFNPIPDRLGVDHLDIYATFEYILIR